MGVESNPLNQFIYKFEDKNVLMEEMTLHFPSDLKQVPDIFLNLYTKTTFGEKRLGYYRIKATEKILQENSLDWFKFKGFGIGNENNQKNQQCWLKGLYVEMCVY